MNLKSSQCQEEPGATQVPAELPITLMLNPHAVPFSPKSHRTLRILVTNAFGITGKFAEFQHLLNSRNIDLAVVTETKLSNESPLSDVCAPGYTTIRRDRNSSGGGVGIWAKTGLSIAQLPHLNSPEHEILWVSLSLQGGNKIVIGAVYRPGSCPEHDTSLIDH